MLVLIHFSALLSLASAFNYEVYSNIVIPSSESLNYKDVDDKCFCRSSCLADPSCLATSVIPLKSGKFRCVDSNTTKADGSSLVALSDVDAEISKNQDATTIIKKGEFSVPIPLTSGECPACFEKTSMGCVHFSVDKIPTPTEESYCSGLQNSELYSASSPRDLQSMITELKKLPAVPNNLRMNLVNVNGKWVWKKNKTTEEAGELLWGAGFPKEGHKCAHLRMKSGMKVASSACIEQTLLCVLKEFNGEKRIESGERKRYVRQVQGSCPDTFEEISEGCIHFSQEKMNPGDGDSYCSGLGAGSQFYSATSLDELSSVMRQLATRSSTPNYPWVNLIMKDDVWIWNGTELEQSDLTTTYWREGNPIAGDKCAYLRKASDMKLSSYSCDGPDNVMCFTSETVTTPTPKVATTAPPVILGCSDGFDEISAGCIHFSDSKMEPSEASEYCSGKNAAFFSAESYEQLVEVRNGAQTISTAPDFPWVNLMYQNGQWVWMGSQFTQEDLTTTYWREGTPIDGDGCVYFRKGSEMKLASYPCNDADYVMCFASKISIVE